MAGTSLVAAIGAAQKVGRTASTFMVTSIVVVSPPISCHFEFFRRTVEDLRKDKILRAIENSRNLGQERFGAEIQDELVDLNGRMPEALREETARLAP